MAKKEKQNGWTTLREIFEVFKGSTLSPDEKVLWMLYRAYDQGAGAWPGDDVLADHMQKGVRSVQRYRSRLLEGGFLLKEFRGPKPASYRAVSPSKASPPSATLEPESLATLGDANPKASPEASPDPAPPLYRSTVNTEKANTSDSESDEVRVFEYWSDRRTAVLPGPTRPPKKTAKRLSKVRARLSDGYTVEDLMLAIDGCLGNAFNVEGGFIDLELICRSDQKVTQYMQWARKNETGKKPFPEVGSDRAAHLATMRAQSKGLSE